MMLNQGVGENWTQLFFPFLIWGACLDHRRKQYLQTLEKGTPGPTTTWSLTLKSPLRFEAPVWSGLYIGEAISQVCWGWLHIKEIPAILKSIRCTWNCPWCWPAPLKPALQNVATQDPDKTVFVVTATQMAHTQIWSLRWLSLVPMSLGWVYQTLPHHNEPDYHIEIMTEPERKL